MYRHTHFDQNKERDEEISSASYPPQTLSQTICHDCAFQVQVRGKISCTHPEELDMNCATVVFCNSFQPSQEIDSPCVTFGSDDAE
jgi:hypothetical protein